MRQDFVIEGALEAMAKLGSGSVSVEPAEPGTAWAAVEPADRDHEPSVRMAERATIELQGRVLVVEVPDSGRLFRRAEVVVRLGLPGGSSATVKGGSVDVRVHGGIDAMLLKLGSGDVDVDVVNELVVKSGQSDVRVDYAQSVTFSTGQGSLKGERVGDATFKAGQGSVEIGRSDGAVAVKGGSVQLDVREAGPGELVFDTGSGSATVGVLAGTTVQLDLMSASGDVRCELPLESSAPEGGAGLRLKLRTGSGDLLVRPARVVAV